MILDETSRSFQASLGGTGRSALADPVYELMPMDGVLTLAVWGGQCRLTRARRGMRGLKRERQRAAARSAVARAFMEW